MSARPSTRPVAIGDVLSLTVDRLGDGPDGLGRVDSYVVFVAGALPGERVRVRVVAAGRKYGRAELLGVERASPQRVAARCPHFGDCGGCQIQQLDYRAQLAAKRERVQNALRFALGADLLQVAPVLAPVEPWHQRCKVVLHLSGRGAHLRGGFFRPRSHALVDVGECATADPAAFALAQAAVAVLAETGAPTFDPRTQNGVLRTVVVRTAPSTGQASLLVVATRPQPPGLRDVLPRLHRAGATAVAVNINQGPLSLLLGPRTEHWSGPERIAERVGGLEYLVSPAAFFQTSRFGVEALVEEVVRRAAPAPGQRAVDLYCGGGLLSLALARRGAEVLGIEENPRAVADARASAAHNAVSGVRFESGRVEDRLAALAGVPIEVAVVDPPRAGCAPPVLHALAERRPRRIVYVACDPDALARDAARLVAAGYQVRAVQPIDMFPHTHHVEAVAELYRK